MIFVTQINSKFKAVPCMKIGENGINCDDIHICGPAKTDREG